jgi:hypothetical protein
MFDGTARDNRYQHKSYRPGFFLQCQLNDNCEEDPVNGNDKFDTFIPAQADDGEPYRETG